MADRIRGIQQRTTTTDAPRPQQPTLRQRTVGITTKEKEAAKERSPSARLAKVLLWVFLIHVGAIYLFTRGFLLSRSVLDSKSECKITNIDDSDGAGAKGSMVGVDGCWYPQQFKKAVVIVIDALRFE